MLTLFCSVDSDTAPFVIADLAITRAVPPTLASSVGSDNNPTLMPRAANRCRLCNATMTAAEGHSRGHTSRHVCIVMQCIGIEEDLIKQVSLYIHPVFT